MAQHGDKGFPSASGTGTPECGKTELFQCAAGEITIAVLTHNGGWFENTQVVKRDEHVTMPDLKSDGFSRDDQSPQRFPAPTLHSKRFHKCFDQQVGPSLGLMTQFNHEG